MNTRRSLIHIVSSNKWGGVQTYALDICRHYAEAGWEVTALTRNAVGVDAPFAEAGIGLLHAPVGGFFDLASPMTLARKLRESPRGATVVHTHRYRDAFTALLAKKIANRPDVRIVTTRHSVRRGRDTRVFRKIYSGISAHIFVSEMCYNAFRHSLKKDITLPPERIHILRNSINAETDTPPAGARSRTGSGALSGCAGKRERTGDTHRCHVAAERDTTAAPHLRHGESRLSRHAPQACYTTRRDGEHRLEQQDSLHAGSLRRGSFRRCPLHRHRGMQSRKPAVHGSRPPAGSNIQRRSERIS